MLRLRKRQTLSDFCRCRFSCRFLQEKRSLCPVLPQTSVYKVFVYETKIIDLILSLFDRSSLFWLLKGGERMKVILKGYSNPNFRASWSSVSLQDIAREYVYVVNVLVGIQSGVYSYKRKTIADSYRQGLTYVRNCMVDKMLEELGFNQ